METPATPHAAASGDGDERQIAARDELRGLRRLRDRVEAAVDEIERLRSENADLAARIAALQDGKAPADGLTMPGGDDLRERLDSYIAAIDMALRDADGSRPSAS